MIKRIIFLIFTAVCLYSCDFTDDALGRWPERTFPISRKNLTAAINQLYKKNAEYKVPGKWAEEDSLEKKSYFFLSGMTFYFKENPEEMYFVTLLVDDPSLADSSKTMIAIRSVSYGVGKWYRYSDESPDERVRIEKRFDKEIISKLELFTGTKALKAQQGH